MGSPSCRLMCYHGATGDALRPQGIYILTLKYHLHGIGLFAVCRFSDAHVFVATFLPQSDKMFITDTTNATGQRTSSHSVHNNCTL
jgi:hypothetical protein